MNEYESMNSFDLEKIFTSRIMFKPETLNEIDGYNPICFTNELCCRINQAVSCLQAEGKEADFMAIVVYFKGMKWRSEGLHEFIDTPSAWLHGQMHQVFDAIRRNYYKQKSHYELHKLSLMAKSDMTIDDIVSKTRGLVDEIERGITATDESHGMPELADESIGYIMKRKQDRLDGKFFQYGLPDLDKKTGGFVDEYQFIVARPSVGKTAFLIHIIESNAMVHPVLFFSLEMIREQIMARHISLRTGINLQRMIKGFVNQDDIDRIEEERERIMKLKLFIHDDPCTFDQIKYVTRRHVERHGVKIILVDYFSLIQFSGSREEELSRISSGLKNLGKQLRIPIIVASQSNDTKEEANKTKDPKLGNVRYTDAVGADADVLMFMLPGVDFIVKKSRNGFTGTSTAIFNKDCVRFETTPF